MYNVVVMHVLQRQIAVTSIDELRKKLLCLKQNKSSIVYRCVCLLDTVQYSELVHSFVSVQQRSG